MGKSEESAMRICGEIEKRTNQKKGKGNKTSTASSTNIFDNDNESYDNKISRIMNEYNIDEAGAKAVINSLIEEERAVLEAEEYALLKQLKEQKRQTQASP